jgi:hypothetical protein
MQIFIITVIENWELFCDDYLKVHSARLCSCVTMKDVGHHVSNLPMLRYIDFPIQCRIR